jgi:transposase
MPTARLMWRASCACCCARSRGSSWSSGTARRSIAVSRGQPIKDFLRRGAATRRHLEQLPGYAPDLNPDEGIWNDLKRVELAHLCCSDLAALSLALRRAKERLRHKRAVIRACFTHAGYQV